MADIAHCEIASVCVRARMHARELVAYDISLILV